MKRKYKGLWIAAILIGLGGFLLLKNLNLLPVEIPSYVFSWKMGLVVLGIIFLLKRRWIAGLILVAIGKYYLLPDFGIAQPDIQHLWPVLLILAGVMILLRTFFPPAKTPSCPTEETLTNDNMDSTVIFGGSSKKISSYNFLGGKLTAIFGGMEIDLTDCCLSKEKTVIDATLIMGGVTLKVPKEWNVTMEVVTIMGGVEDEIQNMPDAYVDPAAEIVVKGLALMGGMEIKRV